MLVPNKDRLIVKRLKHDENQNGIILPGQLKAGDNLFAGQVMHAGETRFVLGQVVYYSEYSAASIMPVAGVLSGEVSLGQLMTSEPLFVVCEDDVMAYEEEVAIGARKI
jgi:co-chaperonin GroES (HSP10)